MPSEKMNFTIGRKGYEVAEVDAHIKSLNSRIDALEKELASANEAEEAVKMTFLAATRTKDELLEIAKEEAERLVADSRYEAFKTLTEANEEAAKTLEEAREEAERLVMTAKEEADRTVSEARREAIQIISEMKEDGEALVAEAKEAAATATEQARAESAGLVARIKQLHAMASEAREALEVVAGTALTELRPLDEILGDVLAEHAAAEPDPVAEEPPAPAEEPPDEEGSAKRSFYARRSAKLPRIGSDGAEVRSAITSLRGQETAAEDSESDAEVVAAP